MRTLFLILLAAPCLMAQGRIDDPLARAIYQNKSAKDKANGYVGLDASGNAAVGTTALCAAAVTVAGTSLTLASAHNGCLVKFSNAGAVTVTVPAGLPAGFTVTLLQLGAGVVSPLADGTTFTTSASTSGVGSSVFLLSTSTNTYVMTASGAIPTVATAAILKGLNGNAVAAAWADVAGFFGNNLLLYSEDVSQNPPWTTINAPPDSASQITTTDAAANLVQQITVSASTNYVFSFDAKIGTIAGPFNYRVRDMDHAADLVTTEYSGELNSTAYTRIYVPFTTPAGCTSVSVYPISSTAATPGSIMFKRLQVNTGTWNSLYMKTNGTGLVWP